MARDDLTEPDPQTEPGRPDDVPDSVLGVSDTAAATPPAVMDETRTSDSARPQAAGRVPGSTDTAAPTWVGGRYRIREELGRGGLWSGVAGD